MCVTRFGEKYLNRVFKFSISQIEIFLFHFSVFDILFLPYMSRMAMAYSQIPIFIWFLLQKRNIFNRKDFSAYRIFSYMIIVSTFISIYTIPESLFFNGISENVKRMFQYIMNMSFFFFFIHIFETYIVSIKKYLLGFLLYVAVLGALYLFDFNLFIEIKEYLNPKDALLEILDDSTGYIYRFSFLWSDPNNIGYIIIAIYTFLCCNISFSISRFLTLSLLIVFCLILIMSSGSWICYISSFCLILIFNIKRRFSLTKLFFVLTLFGLVLCLFLVVDFTFLEEYMNLALDRFESNSSDSRTKIWIDFLENKNIFQYVLWGNGSNIYIDGLLRRPHNGHLYLIYAYGFVAYIMFLFMFRKRFHTTWKEYAFMLPLLFGFTINVGINEQKFFLIAILLYTQYLTLNSKKNVYSPLSL